MMIRYIAFMLLMLLTGQASSAESDGATSGFVWNSKGFRVPIYESADLPAPSRFSSNYLLNGCSVTILCRQPEDGSVQISFLDDTYWVHADHIVYKLPSSPLTITLKTIENAAIISHSETIIPRGSTVETVGTIRDAVFVYWENEYQIISPSAFSQSVISYDSPDYLVSKKEAVAACLQHLQETYNISDDLARTLRSEFLHYFTRNAPALYLIHFYTESGEIYTYHFDGEQSIILYSSYAPYGVG